MYSSDKLKSGGELERIAYFILSIAALLAMDSYTFKVLANFHGWIAHILLVGLLLLFIKALLDKIKNKQKDPYQRIDK